MNTSYLKNLPFDNFLELQNGIRSDQVELDVDLSVANTWIQRFPVPVLVSVSRIALLSTPYIVSLLYIGFIFYSGAWLLVLGIPLLVGAFIFSTPGARIFSASFPGLRLGRFVWIGIWIFAILTANIPLLILLIAIKIISWSVKNTYKHAYSILILTLSDSEELFERFWSAGLVSVISQEKIFLVDKTYDTDYNLL